jgi:hypothetical protein
MGTRAWTLLVGPPSLPLLASLTLPPPAEMRAIYACLPVDFDNDGDGKKVTRLLLLGYL